MLIPRNGSHSLVMALRASAFSQQFGVFGVLSPLLLLEMGVGTYKRFFSILVPLLETLISHFLERLFTVGYLIWCIVMSSSHVP